jgi:hypothetical protein
MVGLLVLILLGGLMPAAKWSATVCFLPPPLVLLPPLPPLLLLLSLLPLLLLLLC